MFTYDELHRIHLELPWFFPLCAALLGACVGSFLNVCIYRIPVGRSVVRPGSHCACGRPVAWHDNIPVLSWLLLRGRARCCGRPISVRYPAVELLTAALFLVCALRFPPAVAACAMLFTAMLVTAAFIDIDHMIIPDRFSIGGAVIGVVLSALVPALHGKVHSLFLVASLQSVVESMLGLLVGSGVVLWIAVLAEKILGKEAMGFGDVKLLGCIGAFTGWEGGVFAVFGGAMLGVAATLVWLPFRGKAAPTPAPAAEPGPEAPAGAEAPSGLMGMPIPFGPMLAAAAVFYLLWLAPYVDDYFRTFATEILNAP